jgi:hypothetical protein
MRDPSERLRLRESTAVWREVDDETIVLKLDSSMYLGVNAAGTVLWNALSEGATRDELVERIRREFEVEEAVARSDVDAFLAACRAHDLLE